MCSHMLFCIVCVLMMMDRPKQIKKTGSSKLQSVEFDVFAYNDDELMTFVLCIFQEEMGMYVYMCTHDAGEG